MCKKPIETLSVKWNKKLNVCIKLTYSILYVSIRCEELHLIDRCHPIEPRPGTLDEILLKHTQEQFDILKATENQTDETKLEELSSHYDAIYIHPVSAFE